MMRTARKVLEGIQSQREAAKSLLDRAMTVRNQVDMGSRDVDAEEQEVNRALRHSLAARIVESD